MDIIEFSYKKPIPTQQIALYKIKDSRYVEISGGGYVRQKYIVGQPTTFQATEDWEKVEAVGYCWQNGFVQYHALGESSFSLPAKQQLKLDIFYD